MVRHNIRLAKTLDISAIKLGSTIAGQAFYERQGYVVYDTHSRLSKNGETKTTLLMRKVLLE